MLTLAFGITLRFYNNKALDLLVEDDPLGEVMGGITLLFLEIIREKW
jgi:hypothetical protein